MDKGWIYIAQNIRDKQEELFKVGQTTDLKKRLESLNSSGVVGKIKYSKTYPIKENLHITEKKIHHEISRHFKREIGKEWFHCPLNEIKKIIDIIIEYGKNFEIDHEHYNDKQIYDYLIDHPNLNLEVISKYANEKNWPCYIGRGITVYDKWERAFYILAKKELIADKKDFFKYLRMRDSVLNNSGGDYIRNSEETEYMDFLQDLQNKVRRCNLKRFLNNTRLYFKTQSRNLMHLGMLIWFLQPLERINKVLTYEWGQQIKQITNNNDLVFPADYIRHNDLEVLEKFLQYRKNNKI